MSIPTDLLDQLLTGYLDDALSRDERARVESLLASDHEVAAQLAELRDIQVSLRAIAQTDSSIQLDSGFADRVIASAVDRARTEGLGEDHPLVRLADQPSVSTKSTDSSHSFRYAAILVGAAASIALAVLALRPSPNDQGVSVAFAEVEPEKVVDDAAVVEDLALEDRLDEPMFVDQTAAAADSSATVASTESSSQVAEFDSPEPMPETQASEQAVAVIQSKSEALQSQIGAILVLDVRLTAAGHMDGAISAAMRKAGMDQAAEKELPEDLLAGFAKAAANVNPDHTTVIYLQASAKTLDRFYLSLLGDQIGVEFVGMSLAMDAPILKVVQSLTPDPTTVLHDRTALELSGPDGGVDALAGELGQLNFAPMNRQAAGAMSSNGPDVPAQILLLVR